MTAAMIEPIKECRQFNEGTIRMCTALERLGKSSVGIVFGLPGILFSLSRQNHISRKAIKEIRKALDKCPNTCVGQEHEASCMLEITDEIRTVRDNYLHMYHLMVKINMLPASLSEKTEKILQDWDELVTDVTIGSDMEVRFLLSQISQAV